MTTGDKQLITIQQFLFNTPLYSKISFDELEPPNQLLFGGVNLDGYCPKCNAQTTYSNVQGPFRSSQALWEFEHKAQTTTLGSRELGYVDITVNCARDKTHSVLFTVLWKGGYVEKIGQHPSLADIANDESKEYISVLSKENSRELHNAIGLAAHGVGVGSYVYLRRIFERLVYQSFEAHKEGNGWVDDDFYSLRMDEKVKYLKAYLPDFLIENRKVYSVLSQGIHSLSEKQCLAYFDILKMSIVVILEQELEAKKKRKLQSELSSAISSFGNDAHKDEAS